MGLNEVSLQHVSLGERMVMAARMMAAEHLRQEADDAGINVKRLQNQMNVVRMSEQATERPIRQDLFLQPDDAVGRSADGKEAA